MERIKAILQASAPARWLFYGDSLTHGAKHTNGKRDFTELFRERVIWEMQRRDDLVLNSAFSGFTTADLLRDFEWRAAAFRPTAAFVMIGSNDSARDGMTPEAFARNLEELLDRFEAIGTRVVLQTPVPALRNLDPKRQSMPLLAAAMREAAARRGVPLIDHYAAWSACPAEFYLHADVLHPNAEGHVRIAHDIFKALGIFEPETSRVCRFFAPDAL